MTEGTQPEFREDRIPALGIEETVEELVELYGGEITSRGASERRFVLPLRRGSAASGGIECTLSWETSGEQATVRMVCDREIDAPKAQRIALLLAGAIGSILFMLWPFFSARREFGAIAWIGGAVAIAVYFLTLRKTSGGLAWDFLQRLARRQRQSVSDSES